MDRAEDSIVVDAGTEPRPKRRRRRGPVNSRSTSPAPQPPAPNPSALLPYEAHPPYDPAESIETALARFKAWMRAGRPHDEGCFACKEPGGVGCATCRRSYHDQCRPSATTPSSPNTDAWFCHICVLRGWQADPPSLTPPASPIQTPAAAEVSATESRTVLPSSRRRRSRSPEQRSAASTSAPEVSHEPERATTRARKSRYTTLPQDVDGALRILYTELECAGEARQQVARLTAETTRLKQELELSQKQLDLERRISQTARGLQQEVTRLRSEAAQNQTAANEIATLRREKEQAEAELRDTKAELEKMRNTLLEWRRSLSSLVNTP